MDNKFNFNINKLKLNNPALQKLNSNNEVHIRTSNNTFVQNFNKNSIYFQKGYGYPGIINSMYLFGQEKSSYMKEIMNLPKEMKEILVLVQNNSQNAVNTKNLSNLLSANIDLSTLAQIMQKNGKEAISQLVTIMAENAKQGIDNSGLKDVLKLINSSISVSAQENQTQVIKNFMLLYLPWLPLQEGKDFELEIETSNKELNDDAILTIFIATVNYGNLKILLVSNTPSSFEVSCKCVKNFPQKDFIERVNKDNKKNSIQSNINFETKDEKSEEKKNHQVRVTMTNLKEVTPYMLIFVNTLIRNTIMLDNEKNKITIDKESSNNQQ